MNDVQSKTRLLNRRCGDSKSRAEEGDRVLVDATAFYLRDASRNSRHAATSATGTVIDSTRRGQLSILPNTKNFPKNTEVEITLTFTTDGEPGGLVRSVTPMPQAITVRERISFVELPPPGLQTARKRSARGLSSEFSTWISRRRSPS